MVMKNLKSLTSQEQKSFFHSFDQIMCDVDGVLWFFEKLIPGADQAIKLLKNIGKKVVFVSNNSLKSHEDYYNQLKSAGYDLTRTDLVTPVAAITAHLKKISFSKEIYVVGMASIKSDIEKAGFKLAESAPEGVEHSIPNFVKMCLKENDKVGAVVFDTDINTNIIKLQRAVTYLRRPEVLFLTGCSSSTLPIGPNRVAFGPGYITYILEDFTGRKGLCLAKPSPEFNDFIIEHHKIKDPSRVLMIGDSVEEDMCFAANCGYKKLLVLSGMTQKSSLKNWTFPEKYKPDYFVDSLGTVYDMLHAIVNFDTSII